MPDFKQFLFDQNTLPEQIAACLTDNSTMPLGPGAPNQGFKIKLTALTIENAFVPNEIVNTDMAKCCLSALWLYHNFLGESHKISQELETQEGSYWHAIMHRREPDFWNSKYWFRRVGQHPIFPKLHKNATVLVESRPDVEADFPMNKKEWDAFLFVDLCEKVIHSGSPTERFCEQIQMLEWQMLFSYCYHAAMGK